MALLKMSRGTVLWLAAAAVPVVLTFASSTKMEVNIQYTLRVLVIEC